MASGPHVMSFRFTLSTFTGEHAHQTGFLLWRVEPFSFSIQAFIGYSCMNKLHVAHHYKMTRLEYKTSSDKTRSVIVWWFEEELGPEYHTAWPLNKWF